MSLRINTNVAALNAYNNLSTNQSKLEGAFQQLSSGLRINKAADDAAGLSIAQGLTSQINGLTQAVSNANDGINVAQIADGALGTTQDILQRMRTLVVKAANEGTQDAKSLGAIQEEITNLNKQLNNIADQTKFGQTDLLNGTYNFNFQVGSNGNETIGLDLSSTNVDSHNVGGGQINAGGTAATDGAADTAVGVNLTLLNILSYDSAGYDPKVFDASQADATDLTATWVDNDWGTSGAELTGVTTYSSAAANEDLKAINAAIEAISTARSNIGAVQNQLTYTVSNLQTAITNVTASRSNLTDADLAQQVTSMTQSQILTQAATSVLAQANSAPQAILKLLQ